MQNQARSPHPEVLPNPVSPDPQPISWPSPTFIDVGHSQVAYRTFGAGPDLLFVHGWPVSGSTFIPLLPLLVPEFTCHVIDLPGAGDSVFDADSKIDLRSHVETLSQVVQSLSLRDYGIVAHDSGGQVARFLAARDPRVRAMVLSGTEIPHVHSKLVQSLAKMSRVPGFAGTLRTSLRSSAFRRSPLGFGGLFQDLDLVEGAFKERVIDPLIRSKHAMWGAIELLRTLDFAMVDELAELHPRLKMPVQLIWGENDPFFPVEDARAMVSQFKDADIHVISAGKLMVHEEFPEEFARVAKRVLLTPEELPGVVL